MYVCSSILASEGGKGWPRGSSPGPGEAAPGNSDRNQRSIDNNIE